MQFGVLVAIENHNCDGSSIQPLIACGDVIDIISRCT